MALELPAAEGEEQSPKKKSRFKLIMVLCGLILLLCALGGGGYWWFYLRPGAEGLSAFFSSSREVSTTDAGTQEAERPQDGVPEKSASLGSNLRALAQGGTQTVRAAVKPVSLPNLTVNLADSSGQRYLNIGMDVEVNAPEAASELQSQTARIRDAIIVLLSSKKVEDLSTAEGKILLKTEVAARLNQILGAQRIVRIYFTEFVIR